MYVMQPTKKTVSRPLIKYAALSSGTVSHVWYDEDTSAKSAQKRKNRITLKHEKHAVKPKNYDA